MSKVLLTGGSGYIAAHVLDLLLERGHTVVTTARSHEKAQKISQAYSNSSKLHVVIVKDIAVDGAFDEVIKSDPPFDVVIHTASPFNFNATDIRKEMLDPAINGTVGILKAIEQHAPSVRRVVITSSFAAMGNGDKGNWPEHTYTDVDWSPMTMEETLSNGRLGYLGSKKFAEKAAWDFVKREKPNFTLTTICPPFVLGPSFQDVGSVESLNQSVRQIAAIASGKCKDEVPFTPIYLWADVRDVALAHVKAMEEPKAEGKRFLIVSSHFCYRDVAAIIRTNFPGLPDLPSETAPGGGYPTGGFYGFDSSPSIKDLGIKYRSLEESIVDLVKSLQSSAIIGRGN